MSSLTPVMVTFCGAAQLAPVNLNRLIEELGLLNRFAVHVADEPIPQNVASYRELSARVHKAAPKLRRNSVRSSG